MVYAVGLSLVAATPVLPSILVLWDPWHHRQGAVPPVDRGELDEGERELVGV